MYPYTNAFQSSFIFSTRLHVAIVADGIAIFPEILQVFIIYQYHTFCEVNPSIPNLSLTHTLVPILNFSLALARHNAQTYCGSYWVYPMDHSYRNISFHQIISFPSVVVRASLKTHTEDISSLAPRACGSSILSQGYFQGLDTFTGDSDSRCTPNFGKTVSGSGNDN